MVHGVVTGPRYGPAMLLLHHDHPSAASLRAVLTLQDLADEGFDVQFRGVDVLGLGTTIPATLDDIADWQAHREALAERGWILPRPRRHPPTLAAHLVEALATARGLGAAWRLACLRGHWFDDVDLGRPEELVTVATGIGLDGDEVAELVADHRSLLAARRELFARRGEGVGGVPVLEVDDTLVSPFMPVDDLRALASL